MKPGDTVETHLGPARVKHVRVGVVETTKGDFIFNELIETQLQDSIDTLTSLIDGENDELATLLTPIKNLLELIA